MSQEGQLLESHGAVSEANVASKTMTKKATVMNCPNCAYSSTNKHYLRQHIDLVHANGRPFKCPFCDYAGKRSHSLKEHLIVHSDERPFKCVHCNAKFRKKGHLTNHYRMHAESQTVPECPLCKFVKVTFASHDDLYLHLRSDHATGSDVVFCCNRCSYATTVQGNLHIHEMGHNDYRHVVLMKPKLPPSASIILKCSDCGFETSERRELEDHVIEKHFDGDHRVMAKDTVSSDQIPSVVPRSQLGGQHTVVPKFKCTECGFITSNEKQLLSHALQHKLSSATDDPSLKKAAADKPVLTVNIPQPEGSYVCTICSYYCDTQRTLKAHMWKHLGHKNLQYPTFQNGPLSVYDDTPLAAKHFVSRPSEVQQSQMTQKAANNNAQKMPRNMHEYSKGVEVDNESTKPKSATSAQTVAAVAQKVVVQSVKRVSDMNTTSYNMEMNEVSFGGESSTADMENYNNNMGDDGCRDGVIAAEKPDNQASGNEEGNKKDSSCYSATEKTAATLLSLLRQGPNINPACPPPGYYVKIRGGAEQADSGGQHGSDSSAIIGDVAGEEVVGTDNTTGSLDSSSLVSDSQSVGKPKKGICSSLLAVIEQLREHQSDESPQSSAARGRRKRKYVSLSEKVVGDEKILPSDSEESHESTADSVVYRCKACQHRTCSVKDMQRHISLHVDQTDDVDVCPSDIGSLLDIDKSLPADDGNVYRCKLCHYRSSAHLMTQHMKVHKTKKPHECSLCDFVATGTSALQDHMIQHCKMRQFQCKLCSTVFNYKSQLRAHTRVHEDGQAFYCDHCEYVTSYIDSFQDHLSLHSEVITSFTCIACREVFSELIKLQTHMKESCEEVKKLHKANPLLKSQTSGSTKQSCDPVSRTLKCDQCEFVALSIRSLKSHLKRHINDKRYIQQPLEQYKCNLCGYVCHHMPSLKSHMWRHANDSDFSYSFNDLLADTSKAVDKRGKPLITLRCCQCGYETLHKFELDKHMKTHWDIIKKTFDVGSNVGVSE